MMRDGVECIIGTPGRIVDLLENNGHYENEAQAQQFKRLAVHIRRNHPEKQWLLGFLASLQPDNEIFQKNYVPPHS